MTLSSEQFHTLYDGAAQPVILVRDGAVAELNCHAQELFAVGTALRAYLPQDAALPEMLYARPAVLPVMAGGVCVSANTQPLDDALLLFLPPQDTRDELAAFCRAAQSISTPLTTLLSVSGTLSRFFPKQRIRLCSRIWPCSTALAISCCGHRRI